MKTILFELFPARSHHMMVFKTAKLLKDAGYRIVFGSIPEMQEIIQQHGFEYHFIPLWVVPPLKHKLALQRKGIPFPEEKARLDEVQKNLDLFNLQLTRLKPDIAFLDRHGIISKTIFYKNLRIPVAFVSPMPDPEKTINVPPFSSGFVPKKNRLSRLYISYLWFSNHLKRKLRMYRQQLAYRKINDLSIYRKLAKDLGMNPSKIQTPNDISGFHWQTTPRLLLSATDLDFPRPEIDDVFKIGPLIDLPADDSHSKDTRYEATKRILKRDESSVIYCSLGMLVDFKTKRKISLYRKFKKVALLSKDDFFILSTGEDLDNANLLPLPPNMFVFKSLPQKDLLKYCTIMINHGGLNSITECIFNEVPVIAYPPSQLADHSSNSARVVYHGLGLRGKIWFDSPGRILKKINHIKRNYHFYQTNIQAMKKKFEKKKQFS